MERRDTHIKNIYEAPLVVVVFLLIIYFFSGQDIFVKIAMATGLVSLISKTAARWLGIVWNKLLKGIGFINAHILLTLVFVLVLIPVSTLYKLFNKDALNLRPGKDSYFVERNHLYSSEDMENPW